MTVCATMSGLVVTMLVDVGQRVSGGDPVCITETMKCETTLLAEHDGWVTECKAVGSTVARGEAIVTLAPNAPSPRPRRWTPAEVGQLLCSPSPLLSEAATGKHTEMTLSADGADRLVAVTDSTPALVAGVSVAVVRHELRGHPDGLSRVLICGDPSMSMGAVSELECRLILAAIDYAQERAMAIEWVAVSAGARIAWESGTENMDWCADVARAIVTFTQGGGAINVIVAGVNVGAQSYWNALATMLWHTAGVLIMIDDQAMVLTGRTALELSGGGAHRSELDMGGYHDVMGPNGEAHHRAADLPGAYRILFDHLALAEVRRDGTPPHCATADDAQRSITEEPYVGPGGFTKIGELLDAEHNPTRKRAFAVRPVMDALADHDAERLDRWADMAGSHPAVVWDTRLGGWPVSLIGIESQPVHDETAPGSPLRASGTLYPQASRKIARAINAASGRRPVVVLANLAGFDGSAESMAGRQLEYGAEIARAIVNFDGPIIVTVIGRFHGGAYVVFNQRLNPQLSIVALRGTYVSVIGGDAAAGVVFSREVNAAVYDELGDGATEALRTDATRRHRDAIARRFDDIHSVTRAASVGSVDEVIEASDLRSSLISRLDRWCWTSRPG